MTIGSVDTRMWTDLKVMSAIRRFQNPDVSSFQATDNRFVTFTNRNGHFIRHGEFGFLQESQQSEQYKEIVEQGPLLSSHV